MSPGDFDDYIPIAEKGTKQEQNIVSLSGEMSAATQISRKIR
jgi:hypothetical protein